MAQDVDVKVKWINARSLEEDDAQNAFADVDAILVPGGFGTDGAAGKREAIRYARTNNVPYFGICFGMQMAVVEYARNVLGDKDATSSEFGEAENPLVGLMTEWDKDGEAQARSADSDLGGTMRLGAYPCVLAEGSKAFEAYGTAEISERHRHRFEVNMDAREALEAAGMVMSGVSPDGLLPEIVELKDHPWFVGVQFHPELKSRPFEPHPLFASFVAAAKAHKG